MTVMKELERGEVKGGGGGGWKEERGIVRYL